MIPIHAHYHVGSEGIDYGVGVLTWERYYGEQMDFLKEVSEGVGYDLFSLHEHWKKNPPKKG